MLEHLKYNKLLINFMFKKTLAVILITIFSLIFANLSLAQDSIIDPSSDSNYATGDYEVNDILNIAIGVTKIILGVVGSITLLMFVYGGLMFLISAGSSEKVAKAKSILVAAVIGLLIVFTSYLIIRFVLSALGRDDFQGNFINITKTHQLSLIS